VYLTGRLSIAQHIDFAISFPDHLPPRHQDTKKIKIKAFLGVPACRLTAGRQGRQVGVFVVNKPVIFLVSLR
jgi:hypothetical protein